MTRKPSCLISCSHASPVGGRGALAGKHGGTKRGERGGHSSKQHRVNWPSCALRLAGRARDDLGPSEFNAEALPLFALLFPDQMRDALLAEWSG